MTLQPCHWRAGVGRGTSPLEMLVCAVDDKVVVGSVVPTLTLSGVLIFLEHSLARRLLLQMFLGNKGSSSQLCEFMGSVIAHGVSGRVRNSSTQPGSPGPSTDHSTPTPRGAFLSCCAEK